MAGEPLELATAYVTLAASAQGIRKGVNKELGQVEGDFEKAGRRAGSNFSRSALKGVAVVGAGLAAIGAGKFLKGTINEASDLNESLNALDVTYGKNAEGIKKLGREAANAMGLSNTEFNAVAVQFAGFTETIAGKGGDVVGTLKDLSTRGSDFASVMNLDVNEAMRLFQSGLAGETEPLRRYGIDLSAAAVENYAMANGIAKAGEKMTEQQKVQARYGLLMEKTAKTQGDFSNTSDSLANSQRRLSANWKNMQATVGSVLLPVLEKVSNWAVDKGLPLLGKLGTFLGNTLGPVFKEISGGITAFGAAWKHNDGEITSSGFPGFMERVGFIARQLFGYLMDTAVPAIQEFIRQFRDGEGAGGRLRDVFDVIWGKAQSLFGYIRDTAIPAMKDLWKFLMDNKQILVVLGTVIATYTAYMWAMNTVTKAVTVAKAAWAAIQKVLNTVMKANPIGLLIAAIAGLIAIVVMAYRENDTFRAIVDKVWKNVKEVILGVVSWFKNTAWPWMRDAFANIADKAQWLKDKAVDAFNKIKDGVSSAWDGAKRILDRFKDGLESLQTKFQNIKDGIARVWSTIGAAIAGPINKVIDTVNNFTKNLAEKLSQIPGVSITIPKIPHVPIPAAASQGGYAGGYQPGRYALGGTVRGRSPHKRADNILARLTAGEFVQPVDTVRHYGAKAMELVRQRKATILPAFANGGQVGGKLGDALSAGGSFLVDLFKGPKKALQGIADRALAAIGDSWPAKAVVGVAKNMVGQLAEWVKEKLFGGAEEGQTGAVGGAMGWQSLWALVKGIFPDAILTSAVRNSYIAGTKIKSLHASGRAIDFALNPWSRMVGATQLLSRLRRWTELIHTPAGAAQQNRGVNTSNFPEITRRMHHNHVHLAAASGGMVADRGAILSPGLNLLDNRTGGPEPLGRLDSKMMIDDDSIEDLKAAFEDAMTTAVRLFMRSRRQTGEDD